MLLKKRDPDTGGWAPWAMLGVLLTAQLLVAYAGRAAAPLAPFFVDEFRLSKAQVGMLQSSVFLGQTLGALPTGALVDALGVRPMLLLVPVVTALTLVGVALSPAWTGIMVLLVLCGTVYGSMHSVTNKGVLEWFPPHRRGTAVGIKQTGVSSGAALAAAVMPALALWLGWRGSLLLNAVLLTACGALAFWLYRRGAAGGGAPALAGPERARAFWALLRNPRLWRISAVTIGMSAVQFSVSGYLLLYLRDALAYPVVAAGAFLALSEVSGSAGRVFWGVLSDRLWGARRQPALQVIAALGALAALGVSLLGPGVPGAVVTGLVVFLGAGTSGYNGIWMNLLSEAAEPRLAGLASGAGLALGSLGAVFGPPLFGLAVDAAGSYRVAWQLAAAVLGAVWVALFFLRLEAPRRPPASP